MYRKFKKIIALALVCFMIVGLMSDYSVVSAAEDDWVGDIYITENTECNYRVVSFHARIHVSEGVTLELNKGIEVEDGSSLTIDGKGTVKARCEEGVNAAIGASEGQDAGEIIINGGTVLAKSRQNAAGIGGVEGGYGGEVTINDGDVEAYGGSNGAGIGSGYNGTGCDITINGGTVLTGVYSGYGAAIGTGLSFTNDNSEYDISINGGQVKAFVEEGAAAIGQGYSDEDSNGTVTITGGNIIAHSGTKNTGIGSCGTTETGDVKISWTNETDSINTDALLGYITVGKDFQAQETGSVLQAGEYPSFTGLGEWTLVPYNPVTPTTTEETTTEETTTEETTTEETTTEETTTAETTTEESTAAETTTEESTTEETTTAETTTEETTTEETTTEETTTAETTTEETTTEETTTAQEKLDPPAGLTYIESKYNYLFMWDAVDGAESYKIYVDGMLCNTNVFTECVLDKSIFVNEGTEEKTFTVSVVACKGSIESEPANIDITVEGQTTSESVTETTTVETTTAETTTTAVESTTAETTTEETTTAETTTAETTTAETTTAETTTAETTTDETTTAETTTAETTTAAESTTETTTTAEESTTEETSTEPTSTEATSQETITSVKASCENIEDLDNKIKNLRSDKDLKESRFSYLKLRSKKQSKKSIKLVWNKMKGARTYVIYANKCGKNNKYKKIASISKSTMNIKKIAGKKLKSGTYYKFFVAALDADGKILSISKTIHVRPNTAKKGNYTKIQVKKSVIRKLKKLKAGKKISIKAKAKGGKLKASKHIGLRYGSMNKKVATVSNNGVIKAVSKGRCDVYVYAQNGIYKKLKIVVK